jgi:hypothetical protein
MSTDAAGQPNQPRARKTRSFVFEPDTVKPVQDHQPVPKPGAQADTRKTRWMAYQADMKETTRTADSPVSGTSPTPVTPEAPPSAPNIPPTAPPVVRKPVAPLRKPDLIDKGMEFLKNKLRQFAIDDLVILAANPALRSVLVRYS